MIYPYQFALPFMTKPVYNPDAFIGIGDMVSTTPHALIVPLDPQRNLKAVLSDITHDYAKGQVDGQAPKPIEPNHPSANYWYGDGLGGF